MDRMDALVAKALPLEDGSLCVKFEEIGKQITIPKHLQKIDLLAEMRSRSLSKLAGSAVASTPLDVASQKEQGADENQQANHIELLPTVVEEIKAHQSLRLLEKVNLDNY